MGGLQKKKHFASAWTSEERKDSEGHGLKA